MASTYLSLHYHLVFATTNRETVIAPECRSRMHEYLGGIISGLGGFAQGVGGRANRHVGQGRIGIRSSIFRVIVRRRALRCDPYRGRGINGNREPVVSLRSTTG